MGLLDQLFGRKNELAAGAIPPWSTRADAHAVERYEQMFRNAPPDVVERAHVEAFEKLTPKQLDLLFARLSESEQAGEDRPADARPKTLARAATHIEKRTPGALARLFRDDERGSVTSAWVAASMFDVISWYAISSVAFTAWTPAEEHAVGDASASYGDADQSVDGEDLGGFWDFGL